MPRHFAIDWEKVEHNREAECEARCKLKVGQHIYIPSLPFFMSHFPQEVEAEVVRRKVIGNPIMPVQYILRIAGGSTVG